ncbi:MAG: PRTRC system protein E [Bacteroidota bacterium]
MFNEISDAIPVKGSLNIVITKTGNDEIAVSVLPKFPEESTNKDFSMAPLTIRGTIEEMEEGFVETIKDFKFVVRKFQTNLLEVKAMAEKEAEKLANKKNQKKTATKAKSTPTKPAEGQTLMSFIKNKKEEKEEK